MEATAHSWQEFLRIVDEEAGSRLSDDDRCASSELWYRGHEKNTYALTPSLFRYRNPETKERVLFDLYTQTKVGHQGHKIVTWETLFDMQHYGIPTRLLDWTATLGNAVFFAATDKADTPCVWVLNPTKMNTKSGFERLIRVPDDCDLGDYRKRYWEGRPKILCPLAVIPTYQNPRLQRQQGRFTVHGSNTAPIDQQFPDCVFKIALTEDTCKEALEVMRIMGINPFSLFPDSVGRAQYVKSEANLEPIPYDEGTASKIRERLRRRAEHDRRILENPTSAQAQTHRLRTKGITACNLGNAYVHRKKEEDELSAWLKSDARSFLFVTGEAGIGKTNFVLYCLLRCKKPFVFVPFKTYGDWFNDTTDRPVKHNTLSQCVSDHMFDPDPLEHEKNVARKMITEGDIILSLDGLDELARVKGEAVVNTVARELEEYIGDSSKARVVISCRDHILNRLQGKRILSTENSCQIRIERLDESSTKQTLSRQLTKRHKGLKRLAHHARVPLFFEIIRRSEDHWSQLLKVCGNDSKLYEAWFSIIHERTDGRPNHKEEWMRQIGKVAGIMLQRRSDLVEVSSLDTYLDDKLSDLVRGLSNRPFSVFVEELKDIYSFSHQSLREFILGWCIANEIKDNKFDLLTSNPSFDYEGGETYQYVHGLLDLRLDLIETLDRLLDNSSSNEQQWNHLTRNIFEAIGMLMPDDDDLAATAVRKAIDILHEKEHRSDLYVFFKTKYNIVRCLERIHSSAPRDPYFAHTLKHHWRYAPRDRDNIGAYAVRGFHMKKQKPGALSPMVFVNKYPDEAIRELEPTVCECLLSMIGNLRDKELPEDAKFLAINCTMALIRWLPEEPDLDRIEKLLKHPHTSHPMKQNMFWAIYRRYGVNVPERFRASGVFKGAGTLTWASGEADNIFRDLGGGSS